ncbi:mitogen-activated protein kinase [Anaeramoeba ignava]|uniref:Mitogen-activated protein kinase n=1 Tax=Anaeramoeba ignava TaxID=1746090 RepID=A0A9Q0LCU6_ANAIG|nr:mitogen-activated protein kinase [Anaeramoeba ignava]
MSKKVAFSVGGTVFEVDSKYKLIKLIGQGAYGVVCSAMDLETKTKVAIKKIINVFGRVTDAKRTLREIKLLKHFKHQNIMTLIDILIPDSKSDFNDVYLVSELVDTDLRRVILSKQKLTNEHIQYFLYQMLCGLKYIHSANVIHRDMKPSNILLNGNCSLKICDFGLARFTDNEDNMLTEYVATRWFRAPEIILSWKEYTKAIDVWSVGCIFAEILGRKTLFPGRNYIHQIELIVELIGTPSVEEIDTFQNEAAKEYMMKVPKKQKQPFSKLYTNADPLALDLLDKMLTFNPDKRITVDEALKHPYLESHYDPDEATECTEKFDFSFENSELSTEELRKLIYEEIIDFHTEKK